MIVIVINIKQKFYLYEIFKYYMYESYYDVTVGVIM